jgi:protein involved in polysaccharide export with SLBB domain
MKAYLHIITLTLLLTFSCGCAHLNFFTQKDYIIHKGDTLRIVVYKQYDYKVIVRPDYKISLPLLGEISCKNKTPKQLSEELSKKLDEEVVVIVEKTNKFQFKDFVDFIKDISWFYFLGRKIRK